ncbi:hypothetical protein IKF15_03195 [Candidatus Saccharibacteria bacterium]|nr:hypothetical protein [Candidatus Saccharibacteria bacterium]
MKCTEKWTAERIILVFNPNSSRAKTAIQKLKPEVESLRASGTQVYLHETSSPDFDLNVLELLDIIEENDLLVAVGGDATASMVFNSAIRASEAFDTSCYVAALPFGNFSDIAANFKCRNLHDVVNGHVEEFWPLECRVDGELWRHAVEYVSTGMYAEACKLFDEKDVRRTIKQHPSARLAISLATLANWWYVARSKKMLPSFKMREVTRKKNRRQRYSHGATNYLAVNGRSVAKILHGRKNHSRIFARWVSRPDRLIEILGQMLEGLLFRLPSKSVESNRLIFVKSARITLQADGEYSPFTARTIDVRKSATPVQAIAR